LVVYGNHFVEAIVLRGKTCSKVKIQGLSWLCLAMTLFKALFSEGSLRVLS
jgi:hypothetical protein